MGYCSHDVGGSKIYLSGVLTSADLYPNLAVYLRWSTVHVSVSSCSDLSSSTSCADTC